MPSPVPKSSPSQVITTSLTVDMVAEPRMPRAAVEGSVREDRGVWEVTASHATWGPPPVGTGLAALPPQHAEAISRADPAAFMLDQVAGDDWLHGTATLGTPRE